MIVLLLQNNKLVFTFIVQLLDKLSDYHQYYNQTHQQQFDLMQKYKRAERFRKKKIRNCKWHIEMLVVNGSNLNEMYCRTRSKVNCP